MKLFESLRPAVMLLGACACSGLFGCSTTDGPPTSDEAKVSDLVESHAPPPLHLSSAHHPSTALGGTLVAPSFALQPKPVSDEDLRALPTNKHEQLRSSPRLRREMIEAKLAAARTGPAAVAQPQAAADPGLIRRQQAFVTAWDAQKAALDRLPAGEREAALATLKHSYVGEDK